MGALSDNAGIDERVSAAPAARHQGITPYRVDCLTRFVGVVGRSKAAEGVDSGSDCCKDAKAQVFSPLFGPLIADGGGWRLHYRMGAFTANTRRCLPTIETFNVEAVAVCL